MGALDYSAHMASKMDSFLAVKCCYTPSINKAVDLRSHFRITLFLHVDDKLREGEARKKYTA